MLCRDLHQAHLQKVGLTQIMVGHVKGITFELESRALTVTALGLCVKWA